MKVALLHDYLNQYGGGERVLEALMEIFPEAPVYTLFYDQEKTFGRFAGRIKKTSFLDWPVVRKNHRLFIPLMPLAARSMNIDCDLVISDTAGFAKGINIRSSQDLRRPIHIAYIHTPLRYAWEPGYLPPIFNSQLSIFKPVLNFLKKWDYRAGQKPDVLIANSNYIAGKIKNYYGREAMVIYPPVDTTRFYHEVKSQKLKVKSYYLAVGRFLAYKRFDLVIDAFAKLGLTLKIVGTGPEEQRLKSRIKNQELKNVEFLPFAGEDELRRLYSGAKALIFPQVEDFGLVAAEAQACGCPVIAFSEGGAREIVQDGVTGLFFHNQTADDLVMAIKRFLKTDFDRKIIEKSAERFSKENFKKSILELAKSAQLN